MKSGNRARIISPALPFCGANDCKWWRLLGVLRWPFDCATPICVDDNGNGGVDDIPGIEMAAHLLCQQLGAATYYSYGSVVSPSDIWLSAIESGQIRCAGHEATVSAIDSHCGEIALLFADTSMSSDESNHYDQLPPVAAH